MIRLSRKVLSIDWDKRSVRLVVARVGGAGLSLDDAHSHRIPNSVDSDDAHALGEFIAQMLKRHRWHHRRVITSIPRDKSVINRLKLPPTPENELANAVRFQALRELPFPLDEAVVDFVTLARDAEGRATEVLLAAVRRESLEQINETCSAAGLTAARVGLRPYANLISALRLPAARDRSVLFVDVGPTMTEIDIVRGGQLAFSRSANVLVPMRGGEIVTDDSRISSKAELAEVESSDEAVDAAVEELVVEMVRTLQAFRATEPDAVISQIVIGGGTGVEGDLLESVERRFGLKTELFDPTEPLGVGASESAKLRSFAAPLGLAWGLDKEGALELDFLNPKRSVHPREVLKKRLRVASLAVAVVALAAGAFGANYYVGKARLLSSIQDQNAELEEQIKELAVIEVANRRVDDWAVEAVWLDYLHDIVDRLIGPGKQMVAKRAAFDARRAKLTLEVMARDLDVFLEFIRRINDVDGGARYRASVNRAWREAVSEPGFKGDGEVEIEILALAKHLATADDREKARRDILRTGNVEFETARKPKAARRPKATTQPATDNAGTPEAPRADDQQMPDAGSEQDAAADVTQPDDEAGAPQPATGRPADAGPPRPAEFGGRKNLPPGGEQ